MTTPHAQIDYSSRAPWRKDLIEALYVRDDYPMPVTPPPAPGLMPSPPARRPSWAYRSLTSARRALAAALRDAAGDFPEMAEDDYAADMVASVALVCSPGVALDLCQGELGFLPHDVRRLRADVVRLARSAA